MRKSSFSSLVLKSLPYVDYDRVKPQVELDYRLTQGDDSVSYRLDTAYNFEFTVKTQQGSDTLLVVSRRSDITG